MRRCVLLLSLGLLAAGCGGDQGKVTGKLVNNGAPVTTSSGEMIALNFHHLGSDGKPDGGRSYPATLNPDGTFEVVASAGQVAPGSYQIRLDFIPNTPAQSAAGPPAWLLPFTRPDSPLRAEVKKGNNFIVVDLARPNG